MIKITRTINAIRKYIADARNLLPEITDDMLYREDTDEFIFYMNGNDGTAFDFHINLRLCEFCVFYKETRLGFIKVFFDFNDTLSGYIYPNKGKGTAIPLETVQLKKDDALYLATLLNMQADSKGVFDKTIDKIDLSPTISDSDCINFMMDCIYQHR